MLTFAHCRDARPRERPYELTCAALPGFMLRVLPSGKKVFFVRHRLAGRDRRERLGLLSRDFTVEDARRAALRVLGGEAAAVARGPQAGRTRAPMPVAAPAASAASGEPGGDPTSPAMTIRALAELFEREHVAVRLKPGTAVTYRYMLRKYIVPSFGDRAIDDLRHADVERLHISLKAHPGAANQMLCVLSSMFNRAIRDWELAHGPNPTARVRKFRIDPVERFLTPHERRTLDGVMRAGLAVPAGRRGHIEQAAVWAINLLALSAMRRDEVCGLEWPMVDWRGSCLRLPDSKTGKKVVPVSSAVLVLLREIHESQGSPRSGLVIRSRCGGRLRTLNRTWDAIRRQAGLADVRLHDLRHSAASDAIMSGVPLQIVGKMLGHKNWQTTQRYAHIADHVVQEAVELMSRTILSATQAAASAPPTSRDTPRRG